MPHELNGGSHANNSPRRQLCLMSGFAFSIKLADIISYQVEEAIDLGDHLI